MVLKLPYFSVASSSDTAGHDDDVLALLPVGRGGDLLLGRELQRVDDPQDLVEVAPGAGRVGQRELDLVVGADDEHRAHGHGVAGVRLDHVVEVGDLLVGIGDQREVHRGALRLLDVLAPLAVGVDRIDAEADHLGVALVELGLEAGHRAQLGGAHRGEVLGVREEHRPAVALPVVEVQLALGGGGGEVGGIVAQSYSHEDLLVVVRCAGHSTRTTPNPDKHRRDSRWRIRARKRPGEPSRGLSWETRRPGGQSGLGLGLDRKGGYRPRWWSTEGGSIDQKGWVRRPRRACGREPW